MKIFSCPACQQTLFFENSACTRCGRRVAYLPELGVMTAVEPKGDGSFVARGARYRPATGRCAFGPEISRSTWCGPSEGTAPCA